MKDNSKENSKLLVNGIARKNKLPLLYPIRKLNALFGNIQLQVLLRPTPFRNMINKSCMAVERDEENKNSNTL